MYRSVDFAFGLYFAAHPPPSLPLCIVGGVRRFIFLFFSFFFTMENVPPQKHFHSLYYIVV